VEGVSLRVGLATIQSRLVLSHAHAGSDYVVRVVIVAYL